MLQALAGPAGAELTIHVTTTTPECVVPDTLMPITETNVSAFGYDSIGGLPPSQTFRLVVWNDVGDGLDGPATTVTTDAAGTATIAVPRQGVFTLTTKAGTVEPRNALPMPD